MTIHIGTAYATIELDVRPLQNAVRRSQDQLAALERSATTAGSVIDRASHTMSQGMSNVAQSTDVARTVFDRVRVSSTETATALDQARIATNRFERGIVSIQKLLSMLTVSMGAGQLVQFALSAVTVANEIETVQASVRALAADQATYNEIIRVAVEQQRIYGGSLAQNVSQIGALANTAKQAGVDIAELVEIAQRLLVVDPTARFEDAVIALREALSGDITSLAERFEVPRKALQELTDNALSGAEKLNILDKFLNDIGVTSEVVNARIETNAQSFRNLQAASEQLTITLGSLLQNALAPVADGLTFVANSSNLALRSLFQRGEVTQQLLSQTTAYEAFVHAQRAYQSASAEVRKSYEAEFAALQQSLTAYEKAIDRSVLLALAKHRETAAYEASVAKVRNLDAQLREQFAQFTSDLSNAQDIYQRQMDAAAAAARKRAIAERLASNDIAGALAIMRDHANLAEEDVRKLDDALQDAASRATDVFAKIVQSSIDYLAQREQAYEQHTAKVASIEDQLQQRLAALQESYEAAKTEKERASIQKQIEDVQGYYSQRLEMEKQAYEQRQQQTAEAYAREQAAQLQHLGRLLIDYTTAQARMAGIAEERIIAMTDAIAREYGVQQSIIERSYEQMLATIDEWVANQGMNTSSSIDQLRLIQNEAISVQQNIDAQIRKMTESARQQFEAGKLSIDEYIRRLAAIPGEAERAASALARIPTRIEPTISLSIGNTAQAVAYRSYRTEERTVPGRASGGPVQPYQMYMVAERGPELLQMGNRLYLITGSLPGTIIPATASSPAPTARPQMAGITVNVNIHHPVVDNYERIAQLSDTIVDRATRAISRTIERVILGGV